MNLKRLIRIKGGPGSGNWSHVGRPGKRGGSGTGGGLLANPKKLGEYRKKAGSEATRKQAQRIRGEGTQRGQQGNGKKATIQRISELDKILAPHNEKISELEKAVELAQKAVDRTQHEGIREKRKGVLNEQIANLERAKKEREPLEQERAKLDRRITKKPVSSPNSELDSDSQQKLADINRMDDVFGALYETHRRTNPTDVDNLGNQIKEQKLAILNELNNKHPGRFSIDTGLIIDNVRRKEIADDPLSPRPVSVPDSATLNSMSKQERRNVGIAVESDALINPTFYDANTYQRGLNVDQPHLGEIGVDQYARMSRRQLDKYEAERSMKWEAARQAKQSWRDAVTKEYDQNPDVINNPHISKDALSVIADHRRKQTVERRLATVAPTNNLKIEDVRPGDTVWEKKNYRYVTVSKVTPTMIEIDNGYNNRDGTRNFSKAKTSGFSWAKDHDILLAAGLTDSVNPRDKERKTEVAKPETTTTSPKPKEPEQTSARDKNDNGSDLQEGENWAKVDYSNPERTRARAEKYASAYAELQRNVRLEQAIDRDINTAVSDLSKLEKRIKSEGRNPNRDKRVKQLRERVKELKQETVNKRKEIESSDYSKLVYDNNYLVERSFAEEAEGRFNAETLTTAIMETERTKKRQPIQKLPQESIEEVLKVSMTAKQTEISNRLNPEKRPDYETVIKKAVEYEQAFRNASIDAGKNQRLLSQINTLESSYTETFNQKKPESERRAIREKITDLQKERELVLEEIKKSPDRKLLESSPYAILRNSVEQMDYIFTAESLAKQIISKPQTLRIAAKLDYSQLTNRGKTMKTALQLAQEILETLRSFSK